MHYGSGTVLNSEDLGVNKKQSLPSRGLHSGREENNLAGKK